MSTGGTTLFEETAHIKTDSGCTPMSVADAVIRDCPDREWLEDVIFFLRTYIDRTYRQNTEEKHNEN